MVEEINEIAIIFKRVKQEYDTIEEFIPFKVVEGYFYEEEGCFIDTEQNVYSHIASLAEVGNVFAGRRNLYDTIKVNPNRSIYDIRKILLDGASQYEYYKNLDEDSNEYNLVKIKDKETSECHNFSDKDTEIYYELYKELIPVEYKNTKETKKENNELTVETENTEDNSYSTPLELINDIKKTIKGQDEAIETIVTLLWMKFRYPDIPKSNMLIIGPSGVGKTAIFKKIKSLLDVPLAIFGITGTSQSGYKGHDIEEMLTQLYFDSGEDIEKAQNGIIFVDEFDKIANGRDLGEIGTTAIQNELLKLIEGCEREISLDSHNSVDIDTSNITFVCCGAFSDLFEVKKEKVVGFNKYPEKKIADMNITPEKIIDYGIIRELVGRLPVIIKLNDLNSNKEVLKDILLNSDESILTLMVNSLNEEGIVIENLDAIIDSIVDSAIEKKIGARGLFGPTRNIFLKVFYEINNNPGKYSKIVFGDNIMNDYNDFKLIPKKVKTRTKKQEAVVE